jgi:hypothetical protein
MKVKGREGRYESKGGRGGEDLERKIARTYLIRDV